MRTFTRFAPVLFLTFAVGVVASAETFTFETGQGGGSLDNLISYTAVSGNSGDPFGALTSTDFDNARLGDKAYILPGTASGWVSSLGAGETAKWIGVDANAHADSSHSGLYCVPFTLSQSASSATLNLKFSVDDMLGDNVNQGLYLDGVAIPGSISNIDWNNQIETKSFGLGALSAGNHYLYLNVNNSGAGPAGLIAKGSVEAVPEPASITLLGAGLAAFFRKRVKA